MSLKLPTPLGQLEKQKRQVGKRAGGRGGKGHAYEHGGAEENSYVFGTSKVPKFAHTSGWEGSVEERVEVGSAVTLAAWIAAPALNFAKIWSFL